MHLRELNTSLLPKRRVRQKIKSFHFDCNPSLLASRILHHSYHSPVAAHPVLFSCNFGRQYYHQLNWRILRDVEIAVKKTPPALRSLVAHSMPPVALRLHLGGQLQLKTF